MLNAILPLPNYFPFLLRLRICILSSLSHTLFYLSLSPYLSSQSKKLFAKSLLKILENHVFCIKTVLCIKISKKFCRNVNAQQIDFLRHRLLVYS